MDEILIPSVAKFTCLSMKQVKNWTPNSSKFLYEYEFQVVTGGSEENDQFFGSTPGGKITLTAVRDNLYEPGRDYYVTFTDPYTWAHRGD